MRFRSIILTFALFLSISSGNAAQELNEILELIFHATPLLTFSGIKPVTLESPDFLLHEPIRDSKRASQWHRVLEDALEKKMIHNPDLVIWRVPDSELQGSKIPSQIHFINKKALERTLRDPEVIQIFNNYDIAIPRNADVAVDLYKTAVIEGGYFHDGPAWCNIVVGVFLGFPPSQVVAYTEARAIENDPRTHSVISDWNAKIDDLKVRKQFKFRGGFATFSNDPRLQKQVASLQFAAKETVYNYLELRKKGISNLDILNHPELLGHSQPMKNSLFHCIQSLLGRR